MRETGVHRSTSYSWIPSVTEDVGVGVVPAITGEQAAELGRWCSLLERLSEAWMATATQLRQMPTADCRARQEDALIVATHGDWGPHEAFNAGLDAVGLIDAATRHVDAVRTLAISGHKALTLCPSLRTALEHIAHAAWLLDPDITAEQRVARRWMLMLANSYRHRWLTSAIRASNTDNRASKRARDQVRAEVHKRFPDADLDWKLEQDPLGPPWQIAEQHYPGLNEAIRRFIAYGGFTRVHGLYDQLSQFAHPNLHTALASVLQRVERDGFVQFGYKVDADHTIWLLRLAAGLLYRAGAVVYSFFSLDPAPLEEWANEAFPADD